MQDAKVPAAPPEKRFSNFIREAVMVGFATIVEPPRGVDFPPRRILVELAPPSGMLSGDILGSADALRLPLPLLLLLLHLLDCVG